MASFLDVCRFNPTAGSTTDWTVSSAVTGYQTPASAGAVNAAVYRYRAESADLSQWEVGFGAYTVAGTVLARSTVLFNSSGTTSKISFTVAPQVAIVALAEDLFIPRGHIAGLTLSTAGSSATFAVAAGMAADSTNIDLLSIASYTKTTSAWALGSAAGSLDTGAIANSTWYHVYLIKRVDTGVVDVLTSLSATAPTMPTNYTLFRRIGSMKTNGSAQWLLFLQIDESFYWSLPVQDVNGALVAATPTTVTLASVPSGVKVRPIVVINPSNTGNTVRVRVYSPDLADNNSNNNMVTGASVTTATNQSSWNEDQANYTNTSQQLRAYTPDANTTLSIFTNGWVDARGRFS